MKIRVLFCGIPLSIGKDSLLITNPEFRIEILDCLHREMERICLENKINFICLKEFFIKDTRWLDHILKYGYIKCPSLPYVSMPINWTSF
jgi:hypothetical protein